MNTRIGAILVVSLCWFTASATGDSRVPNGSFEDGTYYCVPDYSTGACNQASGPGAGEDIVPDGWTLLPSSPSSDFEIESGPYAAEDGTYYAGFMSTAIFSEDCLWTTLDTIPNQDYTVSFWVAITAAAVANTVLIPVWQWDQAGQVDMSNSFYSSYPSNDYGPASNTGPVDWEEFTFTETASTDLVDLMFHGTDANGAILLDNVVVTQVSALPEPASQWLTGLGFVIVGCAVLRRNRVGVG